MKDKWLFLTGATGSVGSVIAERFAASGCNVILCDLDERKCDLLAESLSSEYSVNALPISCNLEMINERVELVGKLTNVDVIDVLINNAAFVGDAGLSGWADTFEKQSIETWRRALEVNLTAPFHLAQLLSPLLSKSPSPSLINIASIYGELGPDWSLYSGTEMGNPAAYSVSKGGLIQLTRWLATVLAPQIRVNAISPGGILRGQPDVFVRRYKERTPLQRFATETDVAGAAFFLAGESADYITGQILNVDGGWSAW